MTYVGPEMRPQSARPKDSQDKPDSPRKNVPIYGVRFTDDDGDVSTIFAKPQQSEASPSLEWQVSRLGASPVRELKIVPIKAGCRVQILGPFGMAQVVDPPPGDSQRRLVENLCRLANSVGVPVTYVEDVYHAYDSSATLLPRQRLDDGTEATFSPRSPNSPRKSPRGEVAFMPLPAFNRIVADLCDGNLSGPSAADALEAAIGLPPKAEASTREPSEEEQTVARPNSLQSSNAESPRLLSVDEFHDQAHAQHSELQSAPTQEWKQVTSTGGIRARGLTLGPAAASPSPNGGKVHMVLCANDYKRTQNPLTSTKDGNNMLDLVGMCNSVEVEKLYDDQCTIGNVRKKIREVAYRCGPDDCFVFYYSGHGTSLKDDDGDEADGRDEALCFVDQDGQVTYDTCLRDDDFCKLITQNIRKDTRIIVISDCCHSGTVADLENDVWKGYQAVSISGCTDKQTSGDTGKGGICTHSILLAIEKLQRKGLRGYSFGELYSATLKQDDRTFDSAQDITIQMAPGVDVQKVPWPFIPAVSYIAPHRFEQAHVGATPQRLITVQDSLPVQMQLPSCKTPPGETVPFIPLGRLPEYKAAIEKLASAFPSSLGLNTVSEIAVVPSASESSDLDYASASRVASKEAHQSDVACSGPNHESSSSSPSRRRNLPPLAACDTPRQPSLRHTVANAQPEATQTSSASLSSPKAQAPPAPTSLVGDTSVGPRRIKSMVLESRRSYTQDSGFEQAARGADSADDSKVIALESSAGEDALCKRVYDILAGATKDGTFEPTVREALRQERDECAVDKPVSNVRNVSSLCACLEDELSTAKQELGSAHAQQQCLRSELQQRTALCDEFQQQLREQDASVTQRVTDLEEQVARVSARLQQATSEQEAKYQEVAARNEQTMRLVEQLRLQNDSAEKRAVQSMEDGRAVAERLRVAEQRCQQLERGEADATFNAAVPSKTPSFSNLSASKTPSSVPTSPMREAAKQADVISQSTKLRLKSCYGLGTYLGTPCGNSCDPQAVFTQAAHLISGNPQAVFTAPSEEFRSLSGVWFIEKRRGSGLVQVGDEVSIVNEQGKFLDVCGHNSFTPGYEVVVTSSKDRDGLSGIWIIEKAEGGSRLLKTGDIVHIRSLYGMGSHLDVCGRRNASSGFLACTTEVGPHRDGLSGTWMLEGADMSPARHVWDVS